MGSKTIPFGVEIVLETKVVTIGLFKSATEMACIFLAEKSVTQTISEPLEAMPLRKDAPEMAMVFSNAPLVRSNTLTLLL